MATAAIAGALPRVVVIAGPTAAGKTALAIALAERWDGEIVSADSMQVYRRMDIGTAKPTPEERRRVPHHMVDVVDPREPFHASLFESMARAVIRRLTAAGKTVFVAGGTGLYIRALLGGLIPGPGADEELRRRYRDLVAASGPAALHEELRREDPRAAARIRPRDAGRTIRALEVLKLSGRSIVDWQDLHGFGASRYRALKIGLRIPRGDLFRRIDERIDGMIRRGLAAEVADLLASGCDETLKPMQSLGYRHMVRHLRGEWTLEEAVARQKRDTRLYAKRQETWFGADPQMHWFHPEEERRIADEVGAFLGGPDDERRLLLPEIGQ